MKLSNRKHGLGIVTEASKIEIDDKSGSIKTQIVSEKGMVKNKDEYIYIDVPDDYKSNKILSILKNASGNVNNKNVISIGKNSDVTVIIECWQNEENSLMEEETEIVINEDSNLKIAIITNNRNTVSMAKRKIELKENSRVEFITFDENAKLSISENVVNLTGNNSKAKVINAYYGDKNQEYEITTTAVHEGRGTESLLLSKGILDGAKATSKGLIRINENAYDSNGYQKSDSLLIGDSRAISIPDLEIRNDKVKCTHGSTTTHLDEEKMFYLQSRGLTSESAKSIMIQAFYDNTLKDIKSEKIKDRVYQIIRQKTGL